MTRMSDLVLLPLWVSGMLATGCPWNAAAQEPLVQGSCADPRACIETLHRGLLELSRGEAGAGVEYRYARLEPLINATHDLAFIARVAVRRHWTEFSAEEQQAFVRAFTRMSVMTYASRFVKLSEDTFRILEVNESAADRAHVVARISRDSQPDIPMEYLLNDGAQGWRIVNVIADGVSDLALRRAEYQRVLAEGSVADLIAELESQVEDLASVRPPGTR